MNVNALLYYFEKVSVREFSTIPQGFLDPSRLAQGLPCWPKLISRGVQQQKTLILADWWAENWDDLMHFQVKVLFAELFNAGFIVYVWHDNELTLLDDVQLFDSSEWCAHIKPEFKEVLMKRAVAQLHLAADKITILQRVELAQLLGQPVEASNSINALYLLHTTHSPSKIMAIEAAASDKIEKVFLRQLSYEPYTIQETKQSISDQWGDLEFIEQFQILVLTNDSVIELNKDGELELIQDDRHINCCRFLYVCLNLTEPHPAFSKENIVQLLGPHLKGLEIVNYPYPIDFKNLTNLRYLKFRQANAIDFSSMSAVRLHELSINKLDDDPLGPWSADNFSELKCLSLSECSTSDLAGMLQHPMPELHALMLNEVHLDDDLHCQHVYAKLQSLSIKGQVSAHCLEALLMTSALNCHRLDLALASITGEFSTNFHIPNVRTLRLGVLDKSLKEKLLKSTDALSILHLTRDITNFSFMDVLAFPYVKSLELDPKNSLCSINAATLKPILSSMPHLNQLKITTGDGTTFEFDDGLSALLNKIEKIHLTFKDSKSISSIDKICDLPGIESINLNDVGPYKKDSIKGMNCLFKSASALQCLMMQDMDAGFNFMTTVSLPDTVVSLDLSGDSISAKNLKKILSALPALQCLNMDDLSEEAYYRSKKWHNDQQLQALFAKIKVVNFPAKYEEFVAYDMVDDASIMGTPYLSQSQQVNADTRLDPNKTYHVNRIFYGLGGNTNPEIESYRLRIFHDVALNATGGINAAFTLHNKGDLDLEELKFAAITFAELDGLAAIYDGYLGIQSFSLDNTWQPIASLTVSDRISHVAASSSDYDIMYSKRDNQYYIRSSGGAHALTLHFLLTVEHVQTPEITTPEIKDLVETFRQFQAGELQFSHVNPSAQEYLDAMLTQKRGACRHRAVAFALNVRERCPVRVIDNDCHLFVEIKQGKTWIPCDLGGYPVKLNIKDMQPVPGTSTAQREVSPQQAAFERCFETWYIERLQQAESPKSYIMTLLNGEHKKQLIYLPEADIAALNIAIQAQAMATQHPVFYIHTPENLVCSAPTIIRDKDNIGSFSKSNGGGPLHDFLTQAHQRAPILIVNYAQFSADDMVRFNGLLDVTRVADGTPVPENTVIIGLMDPQKPDAYQGADVTSRFDRVEKYPCSSIPSMPPVLQAITAQTIEHPVEINLCHASNWMAKLMGSWNIVHGQLHFAEGQLMTAIASGRPVVIRNPPTDSAFDVFWQQARLRKSIHYAARVYPFPDEVVCYWREGYDWASVKDCIAWTEEASATAMVLNPDTLSKFFVQYQFDEHGSFTGAPGLLQQHQNSALDILLTRGLSEDEWGLLLNEAQQYPDIKLNISCAPGVILPKALGASPAQYVRMPECAHTFCKVTDDLDYAINVMYQGAIVLNVSECTASDLITCIDGGFKHLAFVFSEKKQAVLSLLEAGNTVVLSGHFADELLDGLASFIQQRVHSEQAPGTLILLSQQPIDFMHYTILPQATTADKVSALIAAGFDEKDLADLRTEDPSVIDSASYVSLLTRLAFRKQHPGAHSLDAWDGLKELRPSMQIKTFDPARSAQDANSYLEGRGTACYQVLAAQPYLFIAGLTSVGKSRFVENELKDRTIYHGESAMQAWAKADALSKPTLFLDEANLSSRQWSEFEGLFNHPPGILIAGRYYPLSPAHQVIFAGNPLNYGDERILAPLFTRHGNSIVFQPLSNAFIYEKTLKPLLMPAFGRKDCEHIARELLNVYDFLIGISRDEVLISPRQIQMMALSVIAYHDRFPEVDIRAIAKFHAYHQSRQLLPWQYVQKFEQQFCALDRTELLGKYAQAPVFKTFLATASRQKALWQLTDFLCLRDFQRQTELDDDALRYGGLHRFVIEGEPGVGKSEMVIQLMVSMGLNKLQLGDTRSKEKRNGFYHIFASMQPAMQEAILFAAFDEGAIVLIDEINSMPTLEKLLNSLLDGKHPIDHNRPPKLPGFRVLGTQNPVSMAGRRMASPALQNRTQTVYLFPYCAAEMHQILDQMGVLSETTKQALVTAFLFKVEEAKKRHVTPAPCFRDFMNIAQQELRSAMQPMFDKMPLPLLAQMQGLSGEHKMALIAAIKAIVHEADTTHAEDLMAKIQQHIDAYIQSRMGAIVQATLISYLAASANPQTAVEFKQFNHQMMQLETTGLKTIWASIKDDVVAHLFAEFASVYESAEDPRFKALIDAGQAQAIAPLPSFQQQLGSSKGYQQYCDHLLQHRLFNPLNPSSDSEIGLLQPEQKKTDR